MEFRAFQHLEAWKRRRIHEARRGSGQEAGDCQGVWGHRSASGGREWLTVTCPERPPEMWRWGTEPWLWKCSSPERDCSTEGWGQNGSAPHLPAHPTPPPSPAQPSPSCLSPHPTPQPSPSCPILVCPISCLFHLTSVLSQREPCRDPGFRSLFLPRYPLLIRADLTDQASKRCVWEVHEGEAGPQNG